MNLLFFHVHTSVSYFTYSLHRLPLSFLPIYDGLLFRVYWSTRPLRSHPLARRYWQYLLFPPMPSRTETNRDSRNSKKIGLMTLMSDQYLPVRGWIQATKKPVHSDLLTVQSSLGASLLFGRLQRGHIIYKPSIYCTNSKRLYSCNCSPFLIIGVVYIRSPRTT